MRRTPAALAALTVTVAGVGGLVAAAPAGAGTGRTAAYGAFGFTTLGLAPQDGYSEPTIDIAPDGKHVVASTPGCGGVCVWYSADDGKTWGKTATQAGGGDSELEFLPDGTLLSADLELTDSNIKISKDFGRTWDAGRSAGSEQDRQWFAHTPDGKRVFLVYHDLALEAEMISESNDGGRTWTTDPQDQIQVTSPDQVAPPAAAGAEPGDSVSILDQGVNTYSGPMLVDPNGKDFYVVYSISDLQSNTNPTAGVPPFGPVHAIAVGHSGDAGKTWTNRYAVVADDQNVAQPTAEEQNGTMFPWGFIDQAGTVYIVYNSTRGIEGTDHYHMYYTFSKDKGETWSKPVKLDNLPLDKGGVVFNTGHAVSPGVIDVAWMQSDTSTPSGDGTWNVWFAQVKGADTAKPTIVGRQPVSAIPNHKGGICLQGILCGIGPGSDDRSLGDFFELTVNPKTRLAEIAFSDNNRLGDGKGQVVFARQTVQPSLAAPRTPPRTTTEGTATGSGTVRPAPVGGWLAATGLRTALPAVGLLLLVGGLVLVRRRFGARSR